MTASRMRASGIASVSGLVIGCVLSAQPSPEVEAKWIAVGQRCEAPIIRIPGRHGDFEVYVESPAARIALVAATATMMHQPMDAARVRTAMHLPGFRVWVAPTTEGVASTLTIDRITVQPPTGAELAAAEVRWRRLALGIAPSHGIIEPLRARFPEFVFPDLPAGNLQIVLHTTAGVQRYTVTEPARSALIRVCN
jgi:hypothetical protein